jgi:hypothetical protein
MFGPGIQKGISTQRREGTAKARKGKENQHVIGLRESLWPLRLCVEKRNSI